MFEKYELFREKKVDKDFRVVQLRLHKYIKAGLPILNKVDDRYFYLLGGSLATYYDDFNPNPLCVEPKDRKPNGLMVRVFIEKSSETPKVVQDLEEIMGVKSVREDVSRID